MSSPLERRPSSLGTRQSAILSRRISSVYAATAEPLIIFEYDDHYIRAGVGGEAASRCVHSLAHTIADSEPQLENRISLLDLGKLEDELELAIRKAVNQCVE